MLLVKCAVLHTHDETFPRMFWFPSHLKDASMWLFFLLVTWQFDWLSFTHRCCLLYSLQILLIFFTIVTRLWFKCHCSRLETVGGQIKMWNFAILNHTISLLHLQVRMVLLVLLIFQWLPCLHLHVSLTLRKITFGRNTSQSRLKKQL